ncbi:MAG: ADP-ribosylglycohydrolase family protein [Bacteroidota bacterium]
MKAYLPLLFFGLLWSCRPEIPVEHEPPLPMLEQHLPAYQDHQLSDEVLYDKLLGMLVGSAIGDAMGAPTEMWSREQMQLEYGFIDTLDDMVREPSAEGTWAMNLPAGGTTDDTRWKVLMIDYLTGTSSTVLTRPKRLSALSFAEHIQDRYEFGLSQLKEIDEYKLDPYEDQMRRIAWLKEWAMVSKPYAEGDIDRFSDALNKFYGGEMVCAGMLFSPMIGAAYPANPLWAYEQTYRIDIFDIGFAKDISALTASLVAKAMEPGVSPDSVLRVLRDVDPKGYFDSRLVGRTSYKVYRDALSIVKAAKEADPAEVLQITPIKLSMPLQTSADSIKYAHFAVAYERMDQQLQTFPFHPSEIHLVNLVALMLFDFDFQTSMEFVINFGRDNDTTGAVTGAILGAYHGVEALPEGLVQKVLETNRLMGTDLELLAQRLTQSM